jgi:hypothetical protein
MYHLRRFGLHFDTASSKDFGTQLFTANYLVISGDLGDAGRLRMPITNVSPLDGGASF